MKILTATVGLMGLCLATVSFAAYNHSEKYPQGSSESEHVMKHHHAYHHHHHHHPLQKQELVGANQHKGHHNINNQRIAE